MQIQIKLTDWQWEKIEWIRKQYRERGLKYTRTEILNIVLRTHLKAYIDQELEEVLESFSPTIRGRMKGPKEDEQ